MEGTFVNQVLKLEDMPLTWATLSTGNLEKDSERRVRSLCTCLPSPCQHTHSFTGIGVYFFRTLVYRRLAETTNLMELSNC